MILIVAGRMTRFLVALLMLLMLLFGLLHSFSSPSSPSAAAAAPAAPAASAAAAAASELEDDGRWIVSFRSFVESITLRLSTNTEGRGVRKLLYRKQFGVCHRDTVAQSCQPFYNVTCQQGGFRVNCWSCEMIQRCTPQAIGCYSHFMDNITYCGF